MSPSRSSDPPQISFTSWILGGPLISTGNYGPRVSSTPSPRGAHIEVEPKVKKKKSKPKANGGDRAVLEGFEGFEGFELVLTDDAPTVALGDTTKLAGVAAGSEKDKERDASRGGDKDRDTEQGRINAKSGGESSSWTAKQDAAILAMKADSKSWKDIAATVGASKKGVQKRLKELQTQVRSKADGDAIAGDASRSKEETTNGKKGEEDAKSRKNINEEEDQDKDKNKGKAKRKEGAESNNTGGKGRLKADEVWTKEDCEVLEMLESRYTEQKWLQMQAGFYNMTGRMVIADVIRKKFSEG